VTAPAGLDAPLAGALDALRTCVHCGICLPHCPTYRVLEEEMDSPRGRLYLMRAVAEGRLAPGAGFARHMDLCLGCRACESACPSGVPFGALLEATRAELARRRLGTASRGWARLLLALFPEPRRLGVVLALLRGAERLGLGPLVRAPARLRRAPRLAATIALLPPRLPSPAPPPSVVPAAGPRRGRAGLLLGCVQRFLFPEVNRQTARLLALAGWEVVVPRAQGCCGALELHAGRLDAFRARARRLAAAFGSDVDLIVVNAAGCGAALKGSAHWLGDEPVAARLAARVRDVSEVLADAPLPLGPLPLRVTYHDACHLAHGQRLRHEPRAMLARVPGLELVPLADSDLCCGSAGVYNLLEPAVAERLLDLKVERIRATGAAAVVTGNPGCLLQIARGCRARGLPVEVLHPVEVLARAVDRRAAEDARA